MGFQLSVLYQTLRISMDNLGTFRGFKVIKSFVVYIC